MNRAFLFIPLLMLLTCGQRAAAPTPATVPDDSITQRLPPGFLDTLSHRTFNYFWDLAGSNNGQIPDRYPSPSFSSIAATGFGLTCYLVGVERHYITRREAAERVLMTLRFLDQLPQSDAPAGTGGYRGFFYHFLDQHTGLRYKNVELSTIDTGLLMAGILSCQSFFDGDDAVEKEIRSLADALYRAVDWNWAMNGQTTMSMGWHPGQGFLSARYQGYNEAMILYILALGSPTHPVPATTWDAWTSTYQWGNFFGRNYISFGPLFSYQYSHMYIDFRGIQDDYTRSKGIDYFENSRRATLSNRDYCIANPAHYVGYGPDIWGLTACDGPGDHHKANPNIHFKDYSARGAAQWYVNDDGTIAPTAAGGCIPFAPEVCLPALATMFTQYGDSLFGEYGFRDAFNLTFVSSDGKQGWFDKDYLGIDQGAILLQLENYRSGLVWKLMKKNPYIVAGLHKAGFTGGWLDKQ